MTIDEHFKDRVWKNKIKTSLCTVVELAYEPPGIAYTNIVCNDDNCPYFWNCPRYYNLNRVLKG